MPAAKRRDAARTPTPPKRPRPRLILLLVMGPLLCAIALTSLAYVGLTQQARRDTLAQVGVAAQAARGALQSNMGELKVNNGQLSSSLPANVTTLNNNNAEAQQLRALVGVDTVIAQREKSSLVVIASSLASGRAGATPVGLGERLDGALATAICQSKSPAVTTGTLRLGGADYIAGSVPLVDGAGACVGALVALTPVSALQSIPQEYTIILAMAGALLSLLTIAIGLLLYGRSVMAGERVQTEQLRVAVASLAEAESACATQRAQREWVSRRLTSGQRHLEQLMDSLANDRVALQETTSEIWAGVSHPGAPVDPATAMRLAREGAVIAARVGSRLNDFDSITDTLFADLATASEVDAMLTDALAQTETAIGELREIAGVATDDAPSASPAGQARRQAALEDLYATNRVAAQRRNGGTPPLMPTATPRQTGGYRAMRAESSQHRAASQPGQSGATRQTPAAGQSMRQRRPDGYGNNPANSQGGMSGMSGINGMNGMSGAHPANGVSGASGAYRQQGVAGSSGRHPANNPPYQTPRQAPRPPRPAPRARPDTPPEQRNRDSSGSRWLND